MTMHVMAVFGHVMIFIYAQMRMRDMYIDEIFHVAQGIRYCEGVVAWDPKITTPPGLYYAVMICRLPCTLHGMRVLSLLVNIVKSCFMPWWLVFLPIQHIYQNLFYTDLLSELLVVLAFQSISLSMKYAWLLVIGLGTASVFVRQTNLVFLLYCTMIYIARKHPSPNGCIAAIKHFVKALMTEWHVMSVLLGILGGFLYYVIQHGIVQGDHENHVVSFHLPQLLYFSITCMGLFGVQHFPTVRLVALSTLLSFVAVHCFTIHHPFVLSDNRHISFYVWKAFYRDMTVYKELAYSIVYGMSLSCLWVNVVDEWIPKIGFFLSLCLVLVPSLLFEFRYFIPHLSLYGLMYGKWNRWTRMTIIGLNVFIYGVWWWHPAHIIW